jgi:Glycosyl transferase family 2
VYEWVVLVWDEEIDEVIGQRGKVIDRFLYDQSMIAQRSGERIQDLGEEDVLAAGGDYAYASLRRYGRRLSLGTLAARTANPPAIGIAMTTLSLVIPAYNEEARLPDLLEVLATSADATVADAGMRLVESLIVDDGSTDGTANLLRAATAENPRLKPVLEFKRNRGKGAAFAAGVERAQGEYVLLADVDLSTPLGELRKLTAAIRGGADIAIGSRAVPGAVVERGPLHRKVLGETFNGAVRMLTGLRLRDTQNGFKLFPAEAARRLLAGQTCPGFAFDVELLMRADWAGMRIAEVPILYLHDSRSSVRVGSAGAGMLKDVAGLSYRMRWRDRAGRPSSGRASLSGLRPDDRD